MAIKHSTGLANAVLDAGIGTQFDTTGRIEIYTGSPPADADTAPSGTLLATVVLPADVFPAAATRKLTANAISAVTAVASGTAGWFRMKLSADAGGASTTAKRLDGTVTATGGGGDLQLDSTTVTANGQVTITSLVYNHPA